MPPSQNTHRVTSGSVPPRANPGQGSGNQSDVAGLGTKRPREDGSSESNDRRFVPRATSEPIPGGYSPSPPRFRQRPDSQAVPLPGRATPDTRLANMTNWVGQAGAAGPPPDTPPVPPGSVWSGGQDMRSPQGSASLLPHSRGSGWVEVPGVENPWLRQSGSRPVPGGAQVGGPSGSGAAPSGSQGMSSGAGAAPSGSQSAWSGSEAAPSGSEADAPEPRVISQNPYWASLDHTPREPAPGVATPSRLLGLPLDEVLAPPGQVPPGTTPEVNFYTPNAPPGYYLGPYRRE